MLKSFGFESNVFKIATITILGTRNKNITYPWVCGRKQFLSRLVREKGAELTENKKMCQAKNKVFL